MAHRRYPGPAERFIARHATNPDLGRVTNDGRIVVACRVTAHLDGGCEVVVWARPVGVEKARRFT